MENEQNFLRMKMLDNTPLEEADQMPNNENASSLQERKRKEIVDTLKDFFASNDFKDHEGNPATLGEVYWPTPEEEAAYKKIMLFIESDTVKKFSEEKMSDIIKHEDLTFFLKGMARFLNEAATFDSFKYRIDHSTRRIVEIALANAAKEDKQKYEDAYEAYYHNRLSLKNIRNTVDLYGLFNRNDFSDQTNKLYSKVEEWMEDSMDEQGRHSRKYEMVGDAEKLEATHDVSRFIISFFNDLEKFKGEKVEIPSV